MSRIQLILFASAISLLLLPNCNPSEPPAGSDPIAELCDQVRDQIGEEGMKAILQNCVFTDSLNDYFTVAQRQSDNRGVASFNIDPGVNFFWAAKIGVGIETDTMYAYFNNHEAELIQMGFQPHQIHSATVCAPLNAVYQPLWVEGDTSIKMHELDVMVTVDGKPKRRGTLVTQTPLGNTILESDEAVPSTTPDVGVH